MLTYILTNSPIELTTANWLLLAFCALLIGLDKAGIKGVTIITVPIFAALLGGMLSAAMVLPLLMTGDICAMLIYRRKADYSYLKKMLPATLAGLAVGMVTGKYVPDRVFTLLIGVIVSICLILMILKELRHGDVVLPDHWAAHSGAGFLGGLSTMIGNAAGPIMATYLLALNLPKEVFIGTGAVFFFVVNIIKLPIHIFYWGSITKSTLILTASLAPFVLVGIALGLPIVKKIPEKPFKYFVITVTAIGTVRLFL